MASITTTNMSLIIPTVGSELSPTYAYDINSSLTLIDQHDHTPGRGVQITPSAIYINASLDFGNQLAINLAGLTLLAQSSTPANRTIYNSANDLYFVDGLGNNIQITKNGSIAGASGSIAGLVSPASATYVPGSSTFIWQSNASIAANMDFGSAIFRNLSPNSTFGVTMQPPAGLSLNYNLVLPQPPPIKSLLAIDPAGNIVPYTTPAAFPTSPAFPRITAAGAGQFIVLYDIVVGPNADYTTIGAAITAASAGQSIFISEGTYTETVVINKQLTITGAGRSTVIDGTCTLSAGSSLSLIQDVKFNGNVTIAATVTGVQLLTFWIPSANSITDNDTTYSNFIQGMEE